MELPFHVLWLFAITAGFGTSYKISRSDSELILHWADEGNDLYTVNIKENNHIPGSDHWLFFTVSDVTDKPTWRFGDTSFLYEQVNDIDSGEYQFYVNQYIDYETEVSHQYILTTIIGSESIILTINTVNYDDENPTLTAMMCSMNENTVYNKSNTECTATLTDPDGWLSQTTFEIVNSNSDATESLEKENEVFQFTFNTSIADTVYNTTVYLITLKELDYENKTFYSFNVQAKDGAGHHTLPKDNVSCIVDVGDLNDMPPVWTDYFSTKQITEKTPYKLTVTAVDGDRGINAPIVYSLIDYDKDICEDSCVSISTEEKKGVITIDSIDRDAKDISTYKFEIMAQETDDPPYTVNLNVTLYVEDIDDNSPIFRSVDRSNDSTIVFNGTDDDVKVAEFTFYENFDGTIDGSILIKDIDMGENAQFDVRLQRDRTTKYDIDYTEAFLLVPNAGYRSGYFQMPVKNVTYLDFEKQPWQHFSFYLHSTGTKNSSKEDELLIKINLLDYNDEVPKFAEAAYTAEVNETIKKGETITVVKATDADAEDEILRHELIGATAITGLMEIDSAEGIITVAVDDAFDYDRINPVFFQVEAIDNVDHRTTVPVTVSLLDVNNKAPTYKVEDIISVEENQDIGIALNASIVASDVDTTRDLTARIDWDKSFAMKNSIKLDSTDPVIKKAMQFLDLKFTTLTDGSISIALLVSDNNEPNTAPDFETFDTLYLDINITDLNTELPEFQDKMSIDALIAIGIIDINDNPPIFTDDTLNMILKIFERSDNGTIVERIEATDADVGTTVTYSCECIDEKHDWFACDEKGQITAKTDAIDADTGPVYNVSINCSATDGLWIVPHVFTINILDKNNKVPQIKVNDTLPSTNVVRIKEKSDAGEFVTVIKSFDGDRDLPFKTVTCRLNQSEPCAKSFEIQDNVLKVLYGADDLDRDYGTAEYRCTPTCFDNPNQEQSTVQNYNSTTSFTIVLIDINDHCPDMQTRTLEGTENFKKGEEIGAIVAFDPDDGQNSEIEMSILDVTKHSDNGDEQYNTALDLFQIVRIDENYRINATLKQWHLMAGEDLVDHYGEYTLQLELHDLGSPRQSTEDANNTIYKEHAQLKLTIRKFNFFGPVFVFPEETDHIFTLSADQEPGTQLVSYYEDETFSNIEIVDGDDGACTEKWTPTFQVDLIDDTGSLTNFFVLAEQTRCSVQLQVDKTYKKELASKGTTYQIRITVTLDDVAKLDDEANYTATVDMKIKFVDIDEDPIFDQDLAPWNVSLQEANISTRADLPESLKAFYPDIDPTDALKLKAFYFLSSDNATILDTFEIVDTNGSITVLKELDYLQQTKYAFQMHTSRNQSGLFTNEASKLDVIVNVIDINNHVPQWTRASFFGALLKATQKGFTVIQLNATDLDEIDKDKLTYSFNSTIVPTGSDNLNNIDEPFLLDPVTGAVTLNFQIDYHMYGYFSFRVTVQDVQDQFGNGPFYNSTTAKIYIVTDDNIVTFKFENTLDSVAEKLVEITDTISEIFGWECHEQGIDNDSQDGTKLDNVTIATIYCVNNDVLLTADEIKGKLNNINTFQKLKQALLSLGVLLLNFNSDTSVADNLEGSLKAALIGVTVVLGALCVILAVTFFLKTRELSRRLKKLTRPKFGSDESNLNRKGVYAPNTNLFAVEGSNPVFNTEVAKEEYNTKGDNFSIHSGNSDLIGVEDNPEFDEIFGKEKY